jgi:hypothetical protein
MAAVHRSSPNSWAIEVFRGVHFPPIALFMGIPPQKDLSVLPPAAIFEEVLPGL